MYHVTNKANTQQSEIPLLITPTSIPKKTFNNLELIDYFVFISRSISKRH